MAYSKRLSKMQVRKLEDLKARNKKFWETRKARLEAIAEETHIGRVLDFRSGKVLDEGEESKVTKVK